MVADWLAVTSAVSRMSSKKKARPSVNSWASTRKQSSSPFQPEWDGLPAPGSIGSVLMSQTILSITQEFGRWWMMTSSLTFSSNSFLFRQMILAIDPSLTLGAPEIPIFRTRLW